MARSSALATLFCLFSALALAILFPPEARADDSASDWDIVRHDDYLAAATINDSGNILSQHCMVASGDCIWILGIDTRCKKGESHVVLVNSDAGSTALEVYCFGLGGPGGSSKYLYAFANFSGIDEVVRLGSRVGIAFPLQDERFTVEHFSLVGSSRTVDQMRRELEIKASGPNGTKTQIM